MTDLSEGRKLIKAIEQERKRLYQNQQVPIDELRRLVFVTYACSEISIGKASELLCIDLLEFRKQWNEWIVTNPRLQQIHNDYDPFLIEDIEEDIENA